MNLSTLTEKERTVIEIALNLLGQELPCEELEDEEFSISSEELDEIRNKLVG